jgi:anti-sigma B factor antagonist
VVEPSFRIEALDASRAYRVVGTFDVPSAGGITDLLDEVCRIPGDITLDLSEVTFMDSGGLRALLQACLGLGETGVLRLVNPSGQVRDLLDLTGVLKSTPNLQVVDSSSGP